MTVECARCKTKQKIHIANRTEVAQTGNETVLCINCNNPFKVKVPDKLIRGPFPARPPSQFKKWLVALGRGPYRREKQPIHLYDFLR
jgi:hypothetical protein